MATSYNLKIPKLLRFCEEQSKNRKIIQQEMKKRKRQSKFKSNDITLPKLQNRSSVMSLMSSKED